MTSPHWEKIENGRYAAEMHGHTLQAMRRDGRYERDEKPYMAVVDRVPVGDAWSLAMAKTAAIKFVERQSTKSKAERHFVNGRKDARPVDVRFAPDRDAGVFRVTAVEPEPTPETVRPEPEPEPTPEPDPAPSALEMTMSHLGAPGQLAITGRLNDSPNLLDTLNALRSAMELLREHAELECHINLPPMLKL